MYWILKATLFIFSKMPLAVVQKIGSSIGTLAWHLLRERRNVAVANAKVIGVPDPVKCAKMSFKHTFMSYIEISYIHNIDKKFLDRYITAEGAEHYYILKNTQFVFVNAHIGSWDLSPAVVSLLYDFKALLVGRPNNSEAINRLLMDERSNDRLIYMMEEGYIEKIAEYEKQGYISASLLDHSTTQSNSVTAPFFGLKVRTLAGMAAVCVRKKIPMLPCYLIRKKKGFHVVTHPPIYPNNELKIKERIMDLTIRMNEEFERSIKEYPEQWYLIHRRFKKVEGKDGKIYSIYRP